MYEEGEGGTAQSTPWIRTFSLFLEDTDGNDDLRLRIKMTTAIINRLNQV